MRWACFGGDNERRAPDIGSSEYLRHDRHRSPTKHELQLANEEDVAVEHSEMFRSNGRLKSKSKDISMVGGGNCWKLFVRRFSELVSSGVAVLKQKSKCIMGKYTNLSFSNHSMTKRGFLFQQT